MAELSRGCETFMGGGNERAMQSQRHSQGGEGHHWQSIVTVAPIISKRKLTISGASSDYRLFKAAPENTYLPNESDTNAL